MSEQDTPKEVETCHASIYEALAAAQTCMGPALKESTNPAFKSKYADLSNVVAACLPALNAQGIAVFQPMREIGGKRYVVTVLAHKSGQTIENPVEIIVGKNDMQGLGSAITYARRYGLMSMAGIAPEDDDGNAAAIPATRQQQRPQVEARKITPEEYLTIRDRLEATGSDEVKFLEWLKAKDLHELTLPQWEAGMKAMANKPLRGESQ